MASRVCDRCYHSMGNVFLDQNVMTQSITEGSEEEGSKVVMQRSKRSAVVDELASRMPA